MTVRALLRPERICGPFIRVLATSTHTAEVFTLPGTISDELVSVLCSPRYPKHHFKKVSLNGSRLSNLTWILKNEILEKVCANRPRYQFWYFSWKIYCIGLPRNESQWLCLSNWCLSLDIQPVSLNGSEPYAARAKTSQNAKPEDSDKVCHPNGVQFWIAAMFVISWTRRTAFGINYVLMGYEDGRSCVCPLDGSTLVTNAVNVLYFSFLMIYIARCARNVWAVWVWHKETKKVSTTVG